MEKKTLFQTIKDFLVSKKSATATLKEIHEGVLASGYESTGKTLDCSERAIIYRHPETFKQVAKGVYMLIGEKSSSLLIQGDSRSLAEIEDGSIDGCIITDHPWNDPKAHKSGNQKGFAEYETFCYTQEDFNNKARVLADGCFLAEFLPVESATNWKYLSKIKEMAEKAGFKYYAQCIWRKAPEGSINTGRTTKGVEQLIIFSKGNPRRLAPKGKPYMTRNMLSYEIDMPIPAKGKNHQAEKPLALYEYLIENLTEEQEVCLDQFGGACNLAQACVNKNRWGIVYELAKDFVQKAVNRFGMYTLYSPDDAPETIPIVDEPMETFVLETIPMDATIFQFEFLEKIERQAKHLFSETDLSIWNKIKEDKFANAVQLNDLFNHINEIGYASYRKPIFDITLEDYATLQDIYSAIEEKFNCLYPNKYTNKSNLNFKYELEAYAEYAVTKEKVTSFSELQDESRLVRYMGYIQNHFQGLNLARTRRLISLIMPSQAIA
jgi:site-specific DNA-methyltransferase (adenine-specific)